MLHTVITYWQGRRSTQSTHCLDSSNINSVLDLLRLSLFAINYSATWVKLSSLYSLNRVTSFLANFTCVPTHQRHMKTGDWMVNCNKIWNAIPHPSLAIASSVGHMVALNQQKKNRMFIQRKILEQGKVEKESHFWVWLCVWIAHKVKLLEGSK